VGLELEAHAVSIYPDYLGSKPFWLRPAINLSRLVDDLDSSGNPELAILGDNGAGAERVQIRDSISGAQVNTIDF